MLLRVWQGVSRGKGFSVLAKSGTVKLVWDAPSAAGPAVPTVGDVWRGAGGHCQLS